MTVASRVVPEAGLSARRAARRRHLGALGLTLPVTLGLLVFFAAHTGAETNSAQTAKRDTIDVINTFIFTQSGGNEGLGFAAPSNIVKNVYNQIKERGRVRRGEIGVHAQTINSNIAKGLNLSRNWGVVLGDVFPNSPAEKAGLKIGDIVLSLNSKPMENGRQFNVNLYSKNVDDTVALEVRRGEKTVIFRVAVIERQDNYERFADLVTPEENLLPQLRILGLDLSPGIIQMLPKLRIESGVLVADRLAAYSFTEDGFKPGDIIHSINQTTIAGLAGLRRTLGNFAHDELIVVQVERQGKFLYLVMAVQ